MLRSDDIQVGIKPSGGADQQDCTGGYRIDPTGKILFMGIGLGVSQRGPSWCYVTITAMMARLVFDPSRPASDVVLPVTRRTPAPPPTPTAAGAEPAPAAAAAPLSPDRAAVCAQRYRSFDPQTGTYLGTDGARHPCR
jgi:hypothetical protein